MRLGSNTSAPKRTLVVVLTADPEFEHSVRATFGASAQIDLRVVSGTVAERRGQIHRRGCDRVVIDLDTGLEPEMQALQRLMARIGTRPPAVVVTQVFDEAVARRLLQMRVADFLVKPVPPAELVRTCARVASGTATAAATATEAEIYTFLPAVGGAGVTTLAIQTALLLLHTGGRGRVEHRAGRPRFPAWRLRRLPRPRTAARSQRNRAAAGAARSPAAGSDADAITRPASR